MKKKILGLFLVIAAIFSVGFTTVKAAVTSIPETVVSDGLREVTYLENYPVIYKSADNGKYNIYCMNMTALYGENVKFAKTGKVDDGFVYIINNRPQTGNKDKDFYITQVAVWYYEDYLNQNNNNIPDNVKKYIIAHKDEGVSKSIYDLYYGAKYYNKVVGELKLSRDDVKFTEVDGYFVSNEIKLTAKNVDKIEYSLSGSPIGSQIIKKDNGNLVVRVPADKINEGKEIVIALNVKSSYKGYTGYYYYNSSKYQRLLFQDAIVEDVVITDSIKMVVTNWENEHQIDISKTDITQSKEVPGATLVVKDEEGNVVETWVSKDQAHKISLLAGKYTLTETIAPKGYKLSSTTISFMVDKNGAIYVKNDKGTYSSVNKVIMINELLDTVGIRKLDKDTQQYVSGASLTIKNSKNEVVKEFTSGNKIYYTELDPGYYTLCETKAPTGYLLSNEVIYFYLGEDGTIKVKNEKGKYIDSAYVTFYNKKETKQEVPVPATSASSTLLIISGIALLIGGAYCAKKTIKEC